MATTLAQFQTRIRLRADLENDQFVADATLTQWINDSIQELYDLLIAASEDWNLTSSPQTITAGNSTFNVPTGMVAWRGLERSLGGGDIEPIKRGVFAERHSYTELRYVITGSVVRLFPTALAPGSYTAWYIPAPTALSAGGDSFEGVNGWEEYVVIHAAIKAREKAQEDTGTLPAELARIQRRIEGMAKARDRSEPPRVVDVHADDDIPLPY